MRTLMPPTVWRPSPPSPAEETSGERPRPRVIALILSYNSAPLLPKAYANIPKDLVDDIIVTDDGSTDNSVEIARSLGIPVFPHTPNRGYGGNLKAGLRRALERGADYVVEVHGDGQFDSGALREALPFLRDGMSFIIGSRFQTARKARENGMPLSRYLANRGLSVVDRLILRLPFTEFHSGFRIYRRQFLDQIPWEHNAEDSLFSFQVIAQAAYTGVRVAEVPVEADYKSAHSSLSTSGALRYAVQTFRVLAEFLLARNGIRYSACFPSPSRSVSSRTDDTASGDFRPEFRRRHGTPPFR